MFYMIRAKGDRWHFCASSLDWGKKSTFKSGASQCISGPRLGSDPQSFFLYDLFHNKKFWARLVKGALRLVEGGSVPSGPLRPCPLPTAWRYGLPGSKQKISNAWLSTKISKCMYLLKPKNNFAALSLKIFLSNCLSRSLTFFSLLFQYLSMSSI